MVWQEWQHIVIFDILKVKIATSLKYIIFTYTIARPKRNFNKLYINILIKNFVKLSNQESVNIVLYLVF